MEEQTDKLRKIKKPNETMEWRVSNIEKHNQIRRIESSDGLTFFDTELGVFQLTDANGGKIVISDGKIIVTDPDGTDRVILGDIS